VVGAPGPAAFAAIRCHHPHAKITLLTTKSFTAMAEKSGWFDEIIIDTRPKFFDIPGWLKLRAQLRSKNFTRVYDLQTNDRTNFYFRLFFPGPYPEWAGKAFGATFRHHGAGREKLHAWDMRREQLRIAGIAETPFPDLTWLDADIARYNLAEKFVLICAGAAPTRPKKRWPPSHYAKLCEYLLSQNLMPVLIGADAEKEINTEIKSTTPGVIDLTGQTNLFDIAALARRAAGAVGNDTGPMHLIAAAGCPSMSLFSNDSLPSHSRPLGPRTAFLQRDNLADLGPDEVIPAILLR
ncbi:MAG TPA: glycosyltransferase family 9 protein, partial [Alphaproteobacteria bacterium]|nr:glycosyltransferase family 9 protein [Alphaproteobacteria bacterium]